MRKKGKVMKATVEGFDAVLKALDRLRQTVSGRKLAQTRAYVTSLPYL